MRILRIVFCVLACIAVAACIPVGVMFGFYYALGTVLVAALFVVLMLIAKKKSEPAPPPQPDFMNTDEENAAIRQANKEEK